MQVENIPKELRERPQWVVWKKIGDSKVPLQPNGQAAKSNDATTWHTFDDCLQVVDQYAGLGFMFAADDGFAGVDLDGCREPNTGTLEPWAKEIVERIASYAEVSPSGTGIKLWVRGEWKNSNKHVLGDSPHGKEQAVEVYDHKRYFAMTADVIDDQHCVITPQQGALDALRDQYWPKKDKPVLSIGTTSATAIVGTSAVERCRKYVAKCEPSIQGQKGSDAMFRVCCECFRFGLSMDEAREVVNEYNATKCEPPWSEREIEHKLTNALAKVEEANEVGSRLSPHGEKPSSNGKQTSELKPQADSVPRVTERPGRTDLANAQRLAERYQRHLCYVEEWNSWLAYRDGVWKRGKGNAERAARNVITGLWRALCDDQKENPTLASEPNHKLACQFVLGSMNRGRLDAMLKIAQSMRLIDLEVFDKDPHLFNVPNGTIDLRDGILRKHRPEDFITKMGGVEYDPSATCPRWKRFLLEVFDGDRDLVRYVQRLVGYSLTGTVHEHIMPICYGIGSNGKTVMMETLLAMFGDYGVTIDANLLVSRDDSQHPTGKTVLYGARFAVASESNQGGYLQESLVKSLTGGDAITARRMREDFWSFKPSHTLWLLTNHKPRVRGQDDGIWRRLALLPYQVKFKPTLPVNPQPRTRQADAKLIESLRKELPGILAWSVQGSLRYLKHGLTPPKAVAEATQAYRSNEDQLQFFIDEHCEVGVFDPDAVGGSFVVTFDTLWRAYRERMGVKIGRPAFRDAMEGKGYVQSEGDRNRHGSSLHARKVFEDIRLRPSATAICRDVEMNSG